MEICLSPQKCQELKRSLSFTENLVLELDSLRYTIIGLRLVYGGDQPNLPRQNAFNFAFENKIWCSSSMSFIYMGKDN